MIYDVAAFYIFYGDKIGLAPLPGTVVRERTNIGDAQNYGLETFLEINWSKAVNDSAQHQVSSFINASYINANYINSKEPNFLDKRVEYVSALILKTGLKYPLISQTVLFYSVLFCSVLFYSVLFYWFSMVFYFLSPLFAFGESARPLWRRLRPTRTPRSLSPCTRLSGFATAP